MNSGFGHKDVHACLFVIQTEDYGAVHTNKVESNWTEDWNCMEAWSGRLRGTGGSDGQRWNPH
jgi:hypothetical protein